MADNRQTNSAISSGFLIKDKQGNIKKVDDDIIGDYQLSYQGGMEDVVSTQKNNNITNNTTNVVDPSQTSSAANSNSKAIQKQTNIDAGDASSVKPNQANAVNTRAAFIGDADEEEEIRKHQEELDKILQESETVANTTDHNSVVEQIISKFNITFTSDILRKRFGKIIESKIKGVRNSIETVEVLHRQTKVGGMDMPQEKAEAIVKFADEHKQQPAGQPKKDIQKSQQPDVQKETPDSIKSVDYSQAPPSFIPIHQKIKNQPDAKSEKQPEAINKQAEPQEIPKQEQMPPAKPKEQTVENKLPPQPTVEDLYKKSPAEEMSKLAGARQPSQQRPQVVDIKKPASVVGPVDELRQIDLKEFRRMGGNPGEAAEKILEKVYLLEEESWDMRIKGITGWQQSPLHQRYVNAGQASLQQNLPIQEVILSREGSGELSLHFQEFLAINNLNSKLVL